MAKTRKRKELHRWGNLNSSQFFISINSQNDLAKQEYLELDEEELEHRRQLDLKYRDRAKERREGALAGEDQDFDNFDNENLAVEDGDREYYTTTKGLDFDLFIKGKEQERAELLAAKESGKMLIGMRNRKQFF